MSQDTDTSEFDLPDEVEYELAKRIRNPVLDVPQNLILEAAVGLDPLADICARYGYTPEQTEQLAANRGFQIQVDRAATEMKRDGVTFRMRAAHAAEDLIGDIWLAAKKSTTGLMQKIEAFKVLSKMGDMEPKAAVQANAGSGFSITINIPKQVQEEAPVVEAEDVEFKMTIPKARPSPLNAELALPDGWTE